MTQEERDVLDDVTAEMHFYLNQQKYKNWEDTYYKELNEKHRYGYARSTPPTYL